MQSNKKNIELSIVCITFNQEKYIENTIKSFLNQKTSFNFEVVIYDDCSTDNTRGIIESYQSKYPELIRTVFPETNQYSKKRTLPTILATTAAQGEYIALCEGDDYWESTDKLEVQCSALKKHPGIQLSFHSSKNLFPTGGFGEGVSYGNDIKIFSIEDVVKGGGGFMPTPSLMFHSDIVEKFPHYLDGAPVGDFFMQVLGSVKGGALYVPSIYCIYRKDADNSWTSSRQSITTEQLLKEREAFVMSVTRLENAGISRVLIDYCVAKELSYLAITALKAQEYEVSKILVNESLGKCRSVSTTQRLLSLPKSMYPLIRKALAFRSFITSKKQK